jgi:hypothetical protein
MMVDYMSVNRLTVQLVVFEHSEQELLARAFIVKAVRPQGEDVRRANVNVAVDQVTTDIDLAVC